MGDRPIWVLVFLCAACCQLTKLVASSWAERRFAVGALVQSTGLPSLHTAAMSCLAVAVALRDGWNAATTGVALTMAVIVVHDAMRLKGATEQQRRSVYRLVRMVPGGAAFGSRVAGYLDSRAHHPVHVAAGVLFGVFFALAISLPKN
jgi:acid phosphatase family membrane protein YuiD